MLTNETILVAITGLVTAIIVKGGDLFLRWLSKYNQDKSIQDKLRRDGLEMTILYLDSEIKQLRSENVALRSQLDAARMDHTKCLVENERTRQQVEYLKTQIEHIKKTHARNTV